MGKLEKEPYKPGDTFNPHGLSSGMYIPESLARTKLMSLAEKRVWAKQIDFLSKEVGEA